MDCAVRHAEADYDRLAMHRRVDTDSIQVKILHRLRFIRQDVFHT